MTKTSLGWLTVASLLLPAALIVAMLSGDDSRTTVGMVAVLGAGAAAGLAAIRFDWLGAVASIGATVNVMMLVGTLGSA